MMRPRVLYRPLDPWTPKIRAAVSIVAHDLDPRDADELNGLRPDHDPEGMVSDVAQVVRAGMLLDGFVAFLDPEAGDPRAVAFGMAYRSNIPRVAELAFVGRRGEARAIPVIYDELARRADGWGPRHGIALAQIPILASHRAARRKAAETGGVEAFDYGAVGFDHESYTHYIWRWVGEAAF